MKVTAHEFNSEFTQLVRQERGINREVVEMIAFCIKKKFFAELGYSSVIGWLIKGHGYPKNSAYRRIEAAKLVTSVPGAIEKLEAGKVNLSTLATLQSAIRREEVRTSAKIETKRREELLEMIENKTEEQAERVVASEFPEIIKDKVESVKPVSATETRMNLIFTAEEMAVLERVREVTGHSHFNASWSELVVVAAKEFLKHKDPAQKAERSIKRGEVKLEKIARNAELGAEHADGMICSSTDNCSEKGTGAVPSSKGNEGSASTGAVPPRGVNTVQSKAGASAPAHESPKGTGPVLQTASADVSPQLRSFIIYRGGGRCTFIDSVTGVRCDCRTQLEVDHIIPRALGGTRDPENLRTLCRTHNQLLAEIAFGVEFIRTKLFEDRVDHRAKESRGLAAR